MLDNGIIISYILPTAAVHAKPSESTPRRRIHSGARSSVASAPLPATSSAFAVSARL